MILLRSVLIILMMTLVACGTSSSTSTSTTDDSEESGSGGNEDTETSSSEAFPSGLAVASPTASRSSVEANISSLVRAVTIDSEASIDEKVEILEEILAADEDTDCQIELPALSAAVEPSCYGPNVDYRGHPDGVGGDGQLPSGDLGIWTATEDGEACTAAKINSLIQESAAYTDYAMMLSASMICVLERNELALPTDDEDSVNLTSLLNTAVQVNNENVTVSLATITNLADITVDDETYDAYQYALTITETEEDDDEITITAFLKHMPTSDDNATYQGRLWIELDGASQAGDKDAVAVKYEKISETSVSYELMGANYQLPGDDPDIFDEDGNIAIDGDWSGNMSRGIINVNPSTGLGDFSYSWQAGNGDDKARIFNGYTDENGGCGFFGYGDEFDNETGEASDNVIDGFICNWAGPGNDHSMATSENLAQKQCMIVNEATGVLEVDDTRNNISYAPVVDCETLEGEIELKLEDEEEYSDEAVANELVDLEEDEDFADYSAPTAPSLPDGL